MKISRPTSVVVVMGAAMLLGGCRSKPIPVTGTGKVVTENGKEKVVLEIQTDPGTKVSTYSSGRAAATADATGKATLTINGWDGYSAEKTFYVSADKSEKRLVGRPRYRYGSTSIVLTRPPAVRITPSTSSTTSTSTYGTRASVSCVGGKVCTGSINNAFSLALTDVEPGTTVEFAGTRGRTTTRAITLAPDLGHNLATVSLGDVFKDYPLSNFDVPLKLEFSDGTKLETKANFPANALRPALGTTFGKLSAGPVKFPGDADGPVGSRSLLLVPKGVLFGEAEKVTDLDLVAVVTDKTRSLSCGSYRGQVTGRITTLERTLTDATVNVFERRTGKIRATKSFFAEPPPCPTSTYDSASLRAYYDGTQIEPWVRTLVK